jgi:hypothetical protein
MNFGDAMMMGVASIDAALLMGQDTLSRRSLCLLVGGNGCFMMKILVAFLFSAVSFSSCWKDSSVLS